MIRENWFKLSIISFIFFSALFFSFSIREAKAYYDCSQYGTFAYSDGLGYCKCMSGYVMGNSLGSPYCVSGSVYCYDKYGIGSEYDYLKDNCKCSRGYVWDTSYAGQKCVSCSTKYGYGATSKIGGGCECSSGYIFGVDSLGDTKCIDADNICHDKYGYSSSYDTLTDKCECNSGYEFTLGSLGSLECKSCSNKYGLHSSYDYLLKKCECDSGYTLNSENQCVEKQNNVYFILKELNTLDKKAIIKSEYDYKYYLITYGSGCYSSSFNRYKNNRIVVNLGTDFYVDTYDKIILADDNETCDIRSVEKVDSSFSLAEEEISVPYYEIPSASNYTCPVNSTLSGTSCFCNAGYQQNLSKTECVVIPSTPIPTFIPTPIITPAPKPVIKKQNPKPIIKPSSSPTPEIKPAQEIAVTSEAPKEKEIKTDAKIEMPKIQEKPSQSQEGVFIQISNFFKNIGSKIRGWFK